MDKRTRKKVYIKDLNQNEDTLYKADFDKAKI
jgi:hypothetical protein